MKCVAVLDVAFPDKLKAGIESALGARLPLGKTFSEDNRLFIQIGTVLLISCSKRDILTVSSTPDIYSNPGLRSSIVF